VAVTEPALQCLEISKAFGGVPVLHGVTMSLEPGTVTALAGENGAGKSTLMKIASGQERADQGRVLIEGHPLAHADPHAAHRQGVAIVPQELAPILDMKVYENLFVGREVRRAGLLNRRAMVRRAAEQLAVFGVDIDPQATMRSLSVGLRQLVEIAKNATGGARVLLLDEPTSAISDREVEKLYTVIDTLRKQGVAMLYTTHKMEEIRAIADRVVVLRDGGLVLDRPIGEVDDDGIVQAMIGRELEDLFPEVRAAGSETGLQVSGLHVAGYPEPIDLTVRRGEILGLAGLVGAGRTELLEGIFGVRHTTAGTITVADRPVRRNAPVESIARGMALVPEDRKGAGAVLTMSVLDNGSLPRLGTFSLGGFVRQRARGKAVEKAMSSVNLRSRGMSQHVGTLSGGNQQKVVLARWLTQHVDVLLLDEPTRGVDVGARSEIYQLIRSLADRGVAVMVVSSEIEEVLGLADRVLVVREGEVVHESAATAIDEAKVLDLVMEGKVPA
jgi:ribose transport system ATP-binding protein